MEAFALCLLDDKDRPGSKSLQDRILSSRKFREDEEKIVDTKIYME